MRRYNDYELIYLIQSEGCECALNLMFDKYRFLIYKMLHQYNVCQIYFDDYVQECTILMYNIISRFNESKGKTFTKFYEFVLRRKIWSLKALEPKYLRMEDVTVLKDEKSSFDEIYKDNLTDLEKSVYERHYECNQSIAFIAKMEEKSSKQIYNTIFRIKEKYKNNMI